VVQDIGVPGSNTSDFINVVGTVTIESNVTLTIVGYPGYEPKVGEKIVLIQNDGTDPINGTFAGLAEGDVIGNFLGSEWVD
jgi:hypothetical protein